MKKSTARNVYALRGTPFVLVCGHRLYARSEETAASVGQKLVCSAPNVSDEALTVTVAVGEDEFETFGGPFSSEFVEKPMPTGVKRPRKSRRYSLVHPTCGVLFA